MGGGESLMGTPPDIMRDRVKRSCWCLAVVFLLVDSCSGALLDRSKRQGNGDFGNTVQHFLQSDDQAQLEYVRYGLDLLEDGVNGSLGELVNRDQAQDRIFLGSVQSVITALQTILSDPTETPTALASLATDPSNLLTLVTVMVATAFAAQISAFTLFGDPESASNRGLIGLVVDFLADVMNGVEAGGDDGSEGVEDGEMEEADMTGETEGMEDEEEDMESEDDNMEEMTTEGGSGDGMGDSDMDEEEQSQGGLLEAVITFITGLFGGNSNDTEMIDGDGMKGSGDMAESDEEGSGMEDERQEDTMTNVVGDGWSSFGGLSVSLHPIDLAALFVQVQDAIGINCTCADGPMTEEMITDATLRLIEDESRKKKRKFKKASHKTEKKKKNNKNLKNKKEKPDTRKRVP